MLVAFGADGAAAVAITLLCRIATLWFAVVLGGVAAGVLSIGSHRAITPPTLFSLQTLKMAKVGFIRFIMNPIKGSEKKELVFLFFVLAPLFLLAFFFTIPAEDAVILYEYSKNLAEKGIISYGNSSIPIEGATDFLWMLLIAIMKLFRVDEFFSALVLNLIGAIFLVNVIKEPKYKSVALCALITTPYLYASLYGFSAIFFSAVYIYCLLMAVTKRNSFYFFTLILCLVRPDGVVWAAGLIILRLTENWNSIDVMDELKIALSSLIVPGLCYFFGRAWYFSEWLPLPFIVKAAGERDTLIFYYESLFSMIPVLLPALLSILANKDKRLTKRICYLVVFPAIFYGAMRLEQNLGNRFIAPMFFGVLFLLSHHRLFRPLLIFVFASMLLSLKFTAITILSVADSKLENIYYISKELSNIEGKMLITEAGRLAYYSNWVAHDSWGLNTPTFAHRLISEKDLYENNYDLIVGDCDLQLLNEGVNLASTNVRNWSDQCKVLISYIKKADYEVFLVPFYKVSEASLKQRINKALGGIYQCPRYHIFAVNSKYNYAGELKKILLQHHAIVDSPSLIKVGDNRLCTQ